MNEQLNSNLNTTTMYNNEIGHYLSLARENFYSISRFPAVLREHLEATPELMKDVVFFSCMAPLSMYNMRIRIPYLFDREMMGCQVQIFVIANQASGKNNIDFIQSDIMSLMKDFNNSELALEREYERKKARSKSKNIGDPPITTVFMLPASTSKVQVCRRALSVEERYGEPGGVFFYTFSPELGTAVESTKTGFNDLRVLNRVSYDLSGTYGQDHGSELSIHGTVNINQSLLYLGTPGVMANYFNVNSIENGNLSRAIIVPFKQSIGASAPIFKPIPESDKAFGRQVLQILFDEIFDCSDSKCLMPEKVVDISFLNGEVERFQDEMANLAVETQSEAVDTYRKRSSVSAYRIAAICYNMYNIENKLLDNAEQLPMYQIENNVKKIFRFAAYYILHSTLSVFGDTIETLNMQQKNMFKIIRKTGLYESLPEVFSREDIKVCSEKLFLKSPARSIISKWLNCNRIIALSDGRYQKAYGCQNPTK